MMRRNIHFNILLLLLLVEAISVRAVAQIPDRTLYQSISLDEYLKRVGEGNLNYLAEKLNVSIACLLYTSPSPRDKRQSRMPSSA